MMHRPSTSVCRECRTPLPERSKRGRGRPAEFCSPACRQSAYRRRRGVPGPPPSTGREGDTAPDPEAEQQQLLELALDVQEEVRHLVRLLAPGQEGVRSAVACTARLQQHVDVLLAGAVLRARRRRTAWEVIGSLLNMSPETARRTFHPDAVLRQLNRLSPPPRPSERRTSTDGTPAGETPPPSPSLPPVNRAALNRLAPVLSQLHRASGMPLRRLSIYTRVSASYLSRVLTGISFPTWDLTERLAYALGADTGALRELWEAEERRTAAARRGNKAAESPTAEEREAQHTPDTVPGLHSALRDLHRRAGSPTPATISIDAGGTLGPQRIADTLAGNYTPSWEMTQRLVLVLDGEPAFFRPLWQAATHHPSRRPLASTRNSVETLLATFSSVLGTPHPALTADRPALSCPLT